MNYVKRILVVSVLANLLLISYVFYQQKVINQLAINQVVIAQIENNLINLNAKLRIPTDVMLKLLPNLLRVESNFDANEICDGGRSIGAGQVQLRTAKGVLLDSKLTKQDLYNPYVNPFLAVMYLDNLNKRFKSVKKSVSAYNGGLKQGKITNNVYVAKVMGDL